MLTFDSILAIFGVKTAEKGEKEQLVVGRQLVAPSSTSTSTCCVPPLLFTFFNRHPHPIMSSSATPHDSSDLIDSLPYIDRDLEDVAGEFGRARPSLLLLPFPSVHPSDPELTHTVSISL